MSGLYFLSFFIYYCFIIFCLEYHLTYPLLPAAAICTSCECSRYTNLQIRDIKGKSYERWPDTLNQRLLISSTFPWRRWISQIGCSTFLTLNINAARTYTSQQAIPLAMMDILCQSMLRWSARQLWFSILLRKSKSRTSAAWSPSPMPSLRKDVLKSILCGSWVPRRLMITPASTATISMLVRQMNSWHSSRRTTSPLNKPGLLGGRHQTPITAKRLQTLPKASNADLYQGVNNKRLA